MMIGQQVLLSTPNTNNMIKVGMMKTFGPMELTHTWALLQKQEGQQNTTNYWFLN